MSGPDDQPSENHGWITAQNETAAKLVVRGSGGSLLVFAPFESRRLRDDVCANFM